MQFYKYIGLTIILLGWGLSVNAQQEQSLFFMRDSYYSHHANPAFMPKEKVAINFLPGLYFNLSNTGFSFNDVFVEKGDSLYLSPTQLLTSLREYNYLQVNLEVDPISIAFRPSENLYFSIAYRFRYSTYLNYPRSLFDLAWEGNGAFIDQTVDIAPDFQLTAWNEFNVGMGFSFAKKWTVGARVKLLVGAFDISTSKASATIYTDPEIYQLTLATDYRINMASFITPNLSIGGDSSSIENFDPRLFPDGAKIMQPNVGGAFDIGATFDLNEKWRFAVSATDIGAIRWTKNVSNFHSNGEFVYEGVDVASLLQSDTVEFAAIVDTLAERFKFAGSNESYTTWLPAKVYIGAEFTPFYKLSFGTMLYSEFYKGKLFPAFSLSVRKQFGKTFSLGLVYGIRNRRFDNLGINMLLKVGPVRMFVVSDNIIPIFSPFNARNTNLRMGFHLAFGKQKE